MTKIGIASDHAGYEMKEFLVGYLSAMGYDVHDFGPGSPETSIMPTTHTRWPKRSRKANSNAASPSAVRAKG